jgi:hypothetical protein
MFCSYRYDIKKKKKELEEALVLVSSDHTVVTIV